MTAAPLRALVAGATGLVGGYCLSELLASASYARATALVRRPLDLRSPKLDVRVVDFTALGSVGSVTADHAYCCLGTTLRQAGSREAFRAVDFGHVVTFARLARTAGVTRFAAVSSLGADRQSRVFYSRVKGEAEDALAALGFEGLVILRPSLLLGPRRERRRGERVRAVLAGAIRPLLVGPARRYRAVHAATVARAMVCVTLGGASGLRVVESDEIARVGHGA